MNLLTGMHNQTTSSVTRCKVRYLVHVAMNRLQWIDCKVQVQQCSWWQWHYCYLKPQDCPCCKKKLWIADYNEEWLCWSQIPLSPSHPKNSYILLLVMPFDLDNSNIQQVYKCNALLSNRYYFWPFKVHHFHWPDTVA